MTLSSCHLDPDRALVPVLTRMPEDGIGLGDILADSGYAHRDAAAWAVPLRAAGAALIQDLHPYDRGPRGTHEGAIIANGNLYCPATPRPLLEPGPLARGATPDLSARHGQQTAGTARYKLGTITADGADGYHRVMCPAVMGKVRCPLRPQSMTLDRTRTEILTPPEQPPACCAQQTITVPPQVNAKTAQKLPFRRAPLFPCPPHRRRAHLRHRQRPRQQQHRPRLVPPHGPDPVRAVANLPAHRLQPAHPHCLEHPSGPRRPAGRSWAPAQNQAPPRKTLGVPASPPRHNHRGHHPRTATARKPRHGAQDPLPQNRLIMQPASPEGPQATSKAATPAECQTQT